MSPRSNSSKTTTTKTFKGELVFVKYPWENKELEYCPTAKTLVYYDPTAKWHYRSIGGKETHCGFLDSSGQLWDSHDCEHDDYMTEDILKALEAALNPSYYRASDHTPEASTNGEGSGV